MTMAECRPTTRSSTGRPQTGDLELRASQRSRIGHSSGDGGCVERRAWAAGRRRAESHAPGRNYGWPVIGFGVNYSTGLAIHSGTHRQGMEQPVNVWVPSIGISGLMIYTGDRFPRWRGNIFVGGMVGQQLDRLTLDGNASSARNCWSRARAAFAICVRASTASSISSPKTKMASPHQFSGWSPSSGRRCVRT